MEWTADQAMRRLEPDVTRTEWVHRTAGVAVVERRLPLAWVGRKLDLAVAGNGRTYAVTDNDGLDDATGETVFLDLGRLL